MQKVKNTAEPLIQPRLSPSGLRNYWALFGKDVRRDKHLYILLAPYMVLFLLFTVLPVVISIIFSFTALQHAGDAALDRLGELFQAALER